MLHLHILYIYIYLHYIGMVVFGLPMKRLKWKTFKHYRGDQQFIFHVMDFVPVAFRAIFISLFIFVYQPISIHKCAVKEDNSCILIKNGFVFYIIYIFTIRIQKIEKKNEEKNFSRTKFAFNIKMIKTLNKLARISKVFFEYSMYFMYKACNRATQFIQTINTQMCIDFSVFIILIFGIQAMKNKDAHSQLTRGD